MQPPVALRKQVTRATYGWLILWVFYCCAGAVREALVIPRMHLNPARARQAEVPIVSLLTLAITYALHPWIGVRTLGAQALLGCAWAGATVRCCPERGASHSLWHRRAAAPGCCAPVGPLRCPCRPCSAAGL